MGVGFEIGGPGIVVGPMEAVSMLGSFVCSAGGVGMSRSWACLAWLASRLLGRILLFFPSSPPPLLLLLLLQLPPRLCGLRGEAPRMMVARLGDPLQSSIWLLSLPAGSPGILSEV